MTDKLVYWLWLLLCGGACSNKTVAVYEYFKDPQIAYNSPMREYKNIECLTESDIKKFSNKSLDSARAHLAECKRIGVEIITCAERAFPESLKYVNPMPILLFVRGNLSEMLKGFPFAIVGTRKCSRYALEQAEHFAKELSLYGITVISGLADGTDTASHIGALAVGGKTIAVLGNGIDFVYPYKNKKIFEEIIRKGAVISEYPIGSEPLGSHFPQRNRIISGLAKGVLVIEAPKRSGALITATVALDQGKDLFVLPGRAGDPLCEGSNELMKTCARPVTDPFDIIEEYVGLVPQKKIIVSHDKTEKGYEFNKEEKINNIADILSDKPLHITEIVNLSGKSASDVASELTILEVKGKAVQLVGGFYVKK